MMRRSLLFHLLSFLFLSSSLSSSHAAPFTYPISQSAGLGHRFDGIGALSGGGCTSLLLPSYPEPSRSRILDFLFLPGFGASLQLLKVEIGGDAQSTEGTEASHMHTAEEENYERGWEWWMMKEAKKRNPHILLSALSWGFPQWVSEGTGLPFTNSTVHYIINWLKGARDHHNLTIDYIGIWNERGYTAPYIITLHAALHSEGFSHTQVVAHDATAGGVWDLCDPLLHDRALSAAVDIIGGHYPGSESAPECSQTGKPLWASEDNAMSWDVGGPCWARAINQNYVRGNMTASLAWPAISSFYDELAFSGSGLMHAVTPWDGHYDIGHPLWVTAHTTHFTRPGWHYLQRGNGVGLLDGGGSFVSLTDGHGQLTIVIEVMSSDTSQCHWGTGPHYEVTTQKATFALGDSFSQINSLFLFSTNLSTAVGLDLSSDFAFHSAVPVVDGQITLQLYPEMLYTLSTLNSSRGSYPQPPPASPFPLPYSSSFDSLSLEAPAPYFFDQAGSWQVAPHPSGSGRVLRQQVLEPPVSWCGENPNPYSVIGSHQWVNINVSVSVRIETKGMGFVSARVLGGGCVDKQGSGAVVFGVSGEGSWRLCNSTAFTASYCPLSGKVQVTAGVWYRLQLVVEGARVRGWLDGVQVVDVQWASVQQEGWAGIGSSWNYVQFDDFIIQPIKQKMEKEEERMEVRADIERE